MVPRGLLEWQLRSSDERLLHWPALVNVHLVATPERGFLVVVPCLWNSLLTEVNLAVFLAIETFLFRQT